MHTQLVIAATVVLVFCSVSIMALVTRLFVQKHSKQNTIEEIYTTNGCIERQHQLAHISSSWKRLFVIKQDQSRGHWVPTLSGIIKAGDEGLFSSTLFNTVHGRPGEVPLEALYEAFASALRSRPLMERSTYSGEISKFLAGTKRSASSGLVRAKSVSHRATNERANVPSRTRGKSLDFSAAERGLVRSMSMKKPVPVLVPMADGLAEEGKLGAGQGSWMKDGQIAEYRDGRMSVRITSAELAALSILLGSPLDVDANSDQAASRKGAFGVSIYTRLVEDGKHQVTLRQHKRSISQQHARGSGYSPLYAKHLAAGCIPYSQDQNSVHSIIIDDGTLAAIQAGTSLHTTPSTTTTTPQSAYLTSLPTSRNLHFHILTPSTDQLSPTTLIDAIAALPFTGGLPPLASIPMIKTTHFIASAGLPPARLLQRLEALVDKVHRQAPHLALFGPLYEAQHAGLLYRERERLGKLATQKKKENGGKVVVDTIADKAARMSRYVTLLERLMAMVGDGKAQDVRDAVREATRVELRRAYADAVTARNNSPSASRSYVVDAHVPLVSDGARSKSKRHSNATAVSHTHTTAKQSNRSSLASTLTAATTVTTTNVTTPTSPTTSLPSPTTSSSSTFPTTAPNLGAQIEHVLKQPFPLSIETVAFVARMVVVAWTMSVESVVWGEGQEESQRGFKLLEEGKLKGRKLVLC